MNSFLFPIVLVISILGQTSTVLADSGVILIGGDRGLSWRSGGGAIPAMVIQTSKTIEQTNAPGGVIEFSFPDHPNWIFPQRADTTKNILLGLTSAERGGSVFTPLPTFRYLEADFPNMIDNDGNTALEVRAASAGESAQAFGLIIQFDLGAVFGINRIKFFPRNADPAFPAPEFPFQNDFLQGYEIFANDGLPESQREGVLIWKTIALRAQNEEPVVDIRLPTQFVRFLRLKSLTATGFEVAEFQVFAEGFVPRARYISNVFDFGDQALLGNLRWIQKKVGDPSRSRLWIRTRTGNDPQPVEFTRVGVQGSGRIIETAGIKQEIPIEAPWKRAQDIKDSDLKNLVEMVLDNGDVDGREALLVFKNLSLGQRAQITLEEQDYKKLPDAERAAIRDDLTNWSPWSPPYSLKGIVQEDQLQDPALGTPVLSPSPRRYFQFTIEFSNDNFDVATGLGELAFDVVMPSFADSLIAEIFPRTATLGQKTAFTYAVLNKSRPQDSGFDRFEINTPLKAESIGRIEIIGPDGSVQAADFSSRSLVDLPLTQEDFSIIEVRDDGFVISFPRIKADSTLLKVEFESAILRLGTRFIGRALNTENAFLGQQVIAGNAADLSRADFKDSDTQPIGSLDLENLSVAVSIIKDLLINVEADPGVFTPNGDGINDQTLIRYDITNIARPTPVRIEIFDLAGRPIRELYADSDNSGRFARAWEGRDDGGELVLPGNYIFTVSLEAGRGEEKQLGMVRVAY